MDRKSRFFALNSQYCIIDGYNTKGDQQMMACKGDKGCNGTWSFRDRCRGGDSTIHVQGFRGFVNRKKIEREMEKKKRGGKEQSKGSVKNKNVAC